MLTDAVSSSQAVMQALRSPRSSAALCVQHDFDLDVPSQFLFMESETLVVGVMRCAAEQS